LNAARHLNTECLPGLRGQLLTLLEAVFSGWIADHSRDQVRDGGRFFTKPGAQKMPARPGGSQTRFGAYLFARATRQTSGPVGRDKAITVKRVAGQAPVVVPFLETIDKAGEPGAAEILH
jgi:hypothetical protein